MIYVSKLGVLKIGSEASDLSEEIPMETISVFDEKDNWN